MIQSWVKRQKGKLQWKRYFYCQFLSSCIHIYKLFLALACILLPLIFMSILCGMNLCSKICVAADDDDDTVFLWQNRQDHLKSLQGKSWSKNAMTCNGRILENASVQMLGDVIDGFIVNVAREENEEPVRIPPSISAKLKPHQVINLFLRTLAIKVFLWFCGCSIKINDVLSIAFTFGNLQNW